MTETPALTKHCKVMETTLLVWEHSADIAINYASKYCTYFAMQLYDLSSYMIDKNIEEFQLTNIKSDFAINSTQITYSPLHGWL